MRSLPPQLGSTAHQRRDLRDFHQAPLWEGYRDRPTTPEPSYRSRENRYGYPPEGAARFTLTAAENTP
jgi:hypothetical protein